MTSAVQSHFLSWGRCFKYSHQVHPVYWLSGDIRKVFLREQKLLPYGLGRSYGDSCLNSGEALLDTSRLDRFISFDRENGILRCEAGVTLEQILTLTIPAGWFLSVVPGTKHVTVGGAVANDVHGKNHHLVGTFGRSVRCFELIRSDCVKYLCSGEENEELFKATIGGLGLTGLITWVEIQLQKGGPHVEVETLKFKNLEGFFELSRDSNKSFEYTVAWIDFAATGSSLGRGLFIRGNHVDSGSVLEGEEFSNARKLAIKFDAPNFLLNRQTISIFNKCYYYKQLKSKKVCREHYDKFFFPLDGVENWNRIYGSRGFYQYQFVIPKHNTDVFHQIFKMIADSGMASFLAVFKEFGELASPGMMSFPQPGFTLALDFPNYGSRLQKLFHKLDCLIEKNDGRLYPAKDGHMSKDSFRRFYPQWKQFEKFIDPCFSSSFWRRVN